jgi:hypothetical protein
MDLVNHCSENGGWSEKSRVATYHYVPANDDAEDNQSRSDLSLPINPHFEESLFVLVANRLYEPGDQVKPGKLNLFM